MARKKVSVRQRALSPAKPKERSMSSSPTDEDPRDKEEQCLSCQVSALIDSQSQYTFNKDHLLTVSFGIQSMGRWEVLKEEMRTYVGVLPTDDTSLAPATITNVVLRKELKKNGLNPNLQVWKEFATYYTAVSVYFYSELIIDGSLVSVFKSLFLPDSVGSVAALHRAFVAFHLAQTKINGESPSLFDNYIEMDWIPHEYMTQLRNNTHKSKNLTSSRNTDKSLSRPVSNGVSDPRVVDNDTDKLLSRSSDLDLSLVGDVVVECFKGTEPASLMQKFPLPGMDRQLSELITTMHTLFVKFNSLFNKDGVVTPTHRKMFLFMLGQKSYKFYYFYLTIIDSYLASILAGDEQAVKNMLATVARM